MISRTGSKRIAYSVERRAYSKNKNTLYSSLSAKRYPCLSGRQALNAKKGFTLIEVMAASAVLALGMLFIYQGFLNSLDVSDYYAAYLELAPLANEKIWQAQDELSRLGPQAKIETRGEFLKGAAKPVDWDLSYGLIDAESGLYKIDLAFSWKSALRRARILRSAYALFDEKK